MDGTPERKPSLATPKRSEGEPKLVRVDARVPADILERIDGAARRLGLSRTGFLISSAVEKVNRIEHGRG